MRLSGIERDGIRQLVELPSHFRNPELTHFAPRRRRRLRADSRDLRCWIFGSSQPFEP